MKEESAVGLLNKIMDWKTPEDINNEHPDLQALAKSGYDDYKQFRPSMRFIESLALWLNRFPQKKRKAAYRFAKDRLLFITGYQMEQNVSIAYPDHVVPLLIEQVANENPEKFDLWEVKKIFDSNEFKILHNQCLFTGLSDGSYIDQFRRSSKMIDHEQVSRTHEINRTRAEKIKEKLKDRLKPYSVDEKMQYFRNVFLIDDFSASGTSYLKEDDAKINGIKGKIGSFYDSMMDQNDPISELVNCGDLRLFLILYIATEDAIQTIQMIADKKFDSISLKIIPIQTLPESIKFNEEKESEFFELVKDKKFGWENIVDQHISQGGVEKPYLGFGKCALPLILHHNTPNNSLPILHRNDDETIFKGLFPRISRHQ